MVYSIPPDLKVLYRKLNSTPTDHLPRVLPSLVNHVIRSKQALSAAHDPKAKGQAAECANLVNKVKTSITTLVNSRTKEARFVAIALIKTSVDVGGWEMLRGSLPWVRGLLSIVQKADPFVSKELAVVTLARIYVLLQPYQTLVREIATPTIPEYAKACLQLIKPDEDAQITSTPSTVVETICDAFATLLPLYPTTFRPFSNQTIAALRPLLAPTDCDSFQIPEPLKQAARRLVASQHFVAAKSGGSDEWAKLIDGILNNLHATADQLLRAIDESWEPTGGNSRSQPQFDQEPNGGGSKADEFPPWIGIQAGAQRLIGLFDYLSTCLQQSTKSPVSIPLTKLTDAISRVCLIARLSPKTQTWEQSLQTKPAVGREEKEELWSVIPDIHIAALHLTQVMFQRLGSDMLPYASESLDHVLRVFGSGISLVDVRIPSYSVMKDILIVAGPTLPKSMVNMIEIAIKATCRDLQEEAGYIKKAKPAPASGAEAKKNGLSANADLFLQKPKATDEAKPAPLDPRHKEAASSLLATFLSSIPQEHLKPDQRGLLDQTAILTKNRDAMLASVLNPYTDQSGKTYASILPHLTRQFPHDQALEILRTNLRTDVVPVVDEESEMVVEGLEESEDEAMDDVEDNQDETGEKDIEALRPGTLPAAPQVDLPVQSNPFDSTKTETFTVYGGFGDVLPRETSPPKRKHEGNSPVSTKRQELETPAEQPKPVAESTKPIAEVAAGEGADGDDSDDESVHLNMELEDDEDDEDDA